MGGVGRGWRSGEEMGGGRSGWERVSIRIDMASVIRCIEGEGGEERKEDEERDKKREDVN